MSLAILLPLALAAQASEARPYRAQAAATYRGTLISDDDPANDRALVWTLNGEYDLGPKGLTGWGRVGLLQRFIAEGGEARTHSGVTVTGEDTAFEFLDIELGARFAHEAATGAVIGKDFAFTHRAVAYLPTSRTSQIQDLYVALEAGSEASMKVGRLGVALDLFAQYRFHRFAERAGPGGGTLPRVVFGPTLIATYTLFEGDYGSLALDASLGTSWRVHYPSRDSGDGGAPDVSAFVPGALDDRAASSATFVGQDYGWAARATYAPWKFLAVRAGLEYGDSVLRNGIKNLLFSTREATLLTVSVIGRF